MTEFKKRKRRTKKEMELVRSTESQGLGDTIEKVFKATGISKVAKWLLGEDCGCEERKEKLNKLFPYKKPKCLTEDEYNFLITFYDERSSRLKPTEQASILRIYNRVFGIRQEPTRCADCWRRILSELEKVIQTYEQDEQQEQPIEA
jgi:hypothetical protein